MKKILILVKKHKKDLLCILFLLLFISLAWSMLPQMVVRGDGFLYLLEKSHKWFFNLPLFFTGFELSAMSAGYVFSKVFGANIALYYWAVFLTVLAIAVLFYLMVKAVAKNCLVAFASALIFSTSFFGQWDMLTTHCYCFYLERIIPVLFLLPSFLFLHTFLEKSAKRYFIISLLFYFVGVGLGHFSVLLTPLFLFYPIFWQIFNKKQIKDKIKGAFFGASYLGLSAFFVLIQQINESGVGPRKWTFVEFLLNPEKYQYLKQIALQFVYFSQYPTFFQDVTRDPTRYILSVPTAEKFIALTLVVYVFASLVIYYLLPKQRAMLFTVLSGLITMFYLNAYFGQYQILSWAGESRYLYFPTILFAIFWSFFLWAIFWKKKSMRVSIVGLGVLTVYYLINVHIIYGSAAHLLQWNKSTKAIYGYVVNARDALLPNTLVVSPYPEFGYYESAFFTQELGKDHVRYMSEHNQDNIDTWEKAASSAAHVFRLRYNEKCECVKSEKIK